MARTGLPFAHGSWPMSALLDPAPEELYPLSEHRPIDDEDASGRGVCICTSCHADISNCDPGSTLMPPRIDRSKQITDNVRSDASTCPVLALDSDLLTVWRGRNDVYAFVCSGAPVISIFR